MDSHHILFSRDTSLIWQDGGDISSSVRSVLFLCCCPGLPGDGWRARRRTPALLLRHLIISKGSTGRGMIPFIRLPVAAAAAVRHHHSPKTTLSRQPSHQKINPTWRTRGLSINDTPTWRHETLPLPQHKRVQFFLTVETYKSCTLTTF